MTAQTALRSWLADSLRGAPRWKRLVRLGLVGGPFAGLLFALLVLIPLLVVDVLNDPSTIRMFGLFVLTAIALAMVGGLLTATCCSLVAAGVYFALRGISANLAAICAAAGATTIVALCAFRLIAPITGLNACIVTTVLAPGTWSIYWVALRSRVGLSE